MPSKITTQELLEKSYVIGEERYFPWMYDLDSGGRLREWQMVLRGNEHFAISGLADGKHIVGQPTVAKTTNAGRTNERNGEDQALDRIRSIYQKKMDTGYTLNPDEAGSVLAFECMLAHSFKDKKKVDALKAKSIAVQPKLDGARCTVDSSGAWTRGHKRYATTDHIEAVLNPLFNMFPDVVFDGELYNHELKSNFEKLMSLVKRTKPSKEDIAASAKHVQYHIYDIYDASNPDMTFVERQEFLQHTIRPWINEYREDGIIELVHTVVMTDPAQFESVITEEDAKNVADGYEGSMVRIGESVYEQKRSNNLLKVKTFVDEEFAIVDIIEGNGAWGGCAKSVRYQHPNGNFFETGLVGTQEYARKLLAEKDQWIGKLGTVKYQNLTEASGVPRFGVTKILWESDKI